MGPERGGGRSRNELWRTGATRGHVQEVADRHLDRDGDAVLYRMRQTGLACHAGARSRFSNR
jgi:phosphoribosyl-AMP cyclohydrolase